MNSPARRESAEIQALLAQHGWTPFASGAALASKLYDTAVGPKEAQAYLSRSGQDDPNQTLSVTYYSEGRSVMAQVLVPKAAEAAQVERLVAQFAREADAAVDSTYARGIWLRDQREAAGLPRRP